MPDFVVLEYDDPNSDPDTGTRATLMQAPIEA